MTLIILILQLIYMSFFSFYYQVNVSTLYLTITVKCLSAHKSQDLLTLSLKLYVYNVESHYAIHICYHKQVYFHFVLGWVMLFVSSTN